MTHEGFERYWGNQVARREAQFNKGDAATTTPDGSASKATTSASGSGKAALNWMEQREGENEVRDRGQLRSEIGLDPETEAWCAAMTNAALKNSGIPGSGSAVANSFQTWGKAVPKSDTQAGDVVLFTRGKGPGQVGGHVGIATGNTRMHDGAEQIETIAGNSGHAVRRFWHNLNDPSVMIRRSGNDQVADK
jgi:cell wall-associated NlpC family hydrolase